MLWGEPFDRPRAALSAVAEAVVQTALAVLPELVRLGCEAEAAPSVRQWYVATVEVALELRVPVDQLAAVGEHSALPRRERRQLRGTRPRVEVRVALFSRNALDGSFDSHLASERIPVEEQCRARVASELVTLPALVTGVEDEAVGVESLQEHHAHGRSAVARRGC